MRLRQPTRHPRGPGHPPAVPILPPSDPRSPRRHLSFVGITKAFGQNVALSDVTFGVERGEIHAILGQNGAGKSTLAKLIVGLHTPDSGEVHIDGVAVRFNGPKDARTAGVGIVFQQLSLISSLTVAENLHLVLPDSQRFFSRRQLEHASDRLTKSCLNANRLVSHLSFGERQLLELARLKAFNPRILILDEPTSSLSPQATADFFGEIERLRAGDTTVLLITHRLFEALEFADRVTVLKGGRYIATHATSEVDADALIEMMIGNKPSSPPVHPRKMQTDAPVVVSFRSVSYTAKETRAQRLTNLTFDLHAGEILGIAAVIGNGQKELYEILAGLTRWSTGSIMFRGEAFSYQRAYPQIAYVPEDSAQDGLVLSLPVYENLAIGRLHDRRLRDSLLLRRHLRAEAAELIAKFHIKGCPDDSVGKLSGGNQRLTVLARELSRSCALVLAENPTAGLDVAAASRIVTHLTERANEGAAILLLSYDLDLLLSISSRVMVLFAGRITSLQTAASADPYNLAALMSGANPLTAC